ncbi:MAG: hypothetical protein JKY62_00120 [Desulfocapsa sp.]|nr:hypothetical protein [Desulfocapsa sp.]
MKLTLKISLVLLSMLFFTGLTACDQSDQAIDDAAETAKEAMNTTKEKAAEILGTAEETDSEVESMDQEGFEEKQKE